MAIHPQLDLVVPAPGTASPWTLVMMACSATKRARGPESRPIPATDLYDGPLWQTFRTHRAERTNVCVLSGKFGFMHAGTYIREYEARLSHQRADYLIERGIHAHNDHFGAIKPGRMPGCSAFVEAGACWQLRPWDPHPYARVIMVGSGAYMRVFESYLREFQAEGLVRRDAEVLRTAGGIGEQRSQLGRFLREAA